FEEEKKRLRKQISTLNKELEVVKRKLSNKQFLEKAPPEIVEKVRNRVGEMNAKLEKLGKSLRLIESVRP
ncbi:MAG: hypothetical protein JRJ03_02500, partial [Deltaproteobacteria bacterium]|nr:hypothetical protein [Deltaproteobacteria bacterium]